jgi:ATPase family protein associated with various cellular activities (AAA)
MGYVECVVDRVVDRIRERLRTLPAGLPDLSWLPDHGARDVPVEGPLARLSPLEADVVVAAGLIELDIRFGALFATLQNPLQSRRPCVGLLCWLLHEPDVTGVCHDLSRRGLLAIDNLEDPRAEWVMRLPVPVWDAVRTGRIDPTTLPSQLTLRTDFPPLEDVAVSSGQASLPKRLPDLLTDPMMSALVMRGAGGSGRTTLLGAAASTLGLDILVYDGELAGPSWPVFEALTLLTPVLPVVRVDPGPGEVLTLPPFRVENQPLGVVCGRSGGLTGPSLEHGLTVTVLPVGREGRRRLWAAGGVDDLTADADEIADRFLLTPGNVSRAAPVARLQAQAEGRSLVVAEDVRAASRVLRRQELETLATLLDPLPPQARPVLSPAARAEFDALLVRCRHRERLSESVAHAGLNRGVRAMFSGASGTGKTLAARHLAAVLALDLYRVDLAAVVNKYIGETERNLDRVLTRAEELDIVLLLDEGDALMTRRTDVSSANDRYANLETNFLLQRLETFDGIIVVTSNAAGRIDPAFLRRIDVTVDFVPPDAGQRRQIWNSHLPSNHQVSEPVLDDLARRCALTGGQIRNAAVHASLLAIDLDCPVGSAEIVDAVRREYQRSGASSPLPPASPRSLSARV